MNWLGFHICKACFWSQIRISRRYTQPYLRHYYAEQALIFSNRFFQQWTGINAILYYAPTIFKDLGLTSVTVSLLATGVVGIVMFIATIPSVLYIDRVGRKPVLTIGAIGMATCHIIIAAIVATYRDSWETHKAAGWAAVAMVWYANPRLSKHLKSNGS